jgi:hypothetical protein
VVFVAARPQAYLGLHCGSGAFPTVIGHCNNDVDMLCVNVADNSGQQQNSSSSVNTFQQTAQIARFISVYAKNRCNVCFWLCCWPPDIASRL